MNGVRRALGIIALCASPLVAAQGAPAEPLWRIGGFGTVGAGYHGSEGIQYRRDLEQAKGIEGGRIGFRTDTRFGVQAGATFDGQWSALVQGVSRLNGEGNWEPSLTWAFVRYSPVDWLDVRVGRLGVDVYLAGDSRHVGYTYTAARPQPEVLGMVTQDRFDGVDLTLHQPAGAGVASLKLYGGRTRGDLYLYGNPIDTADTSTLGATLEWASESFTVRAAWGDMEAHGDEALLPLASALSQVALPAPFQAQEALAHQRAGEIGTRHNVTFWGLGASYERGPFSLEGMLGWKRFTGFPDYHGSGAAAIAAYRIGAWKPYVIYGRTDFEPERRSLSLPALAPQLVELQAGYERVVDRLTMNQHSIGAGVRYDFATNRALKVQVDHVKAAESVVLMTSQGMPARDVSLTLYSVVLDFVF